jgi:uncharacterized protein YdhG (YjbR/CyaY superfamily)
MQTEIQQYIDSVTDERRDLLLKLQSLVVDLFPQVQKRISYQIVKYETKTGWLFLSYWKQGVSIHVGYLPLLATFKEKYPHIKTGKGSVNFKLKDDIPWDFLQQMIEQAMAGR